MGTLMVHFIPWGMDYFLQEPDFCSCPISYPGMLTELMHSSPLGGHSRFHKTYHRLKSEFYWKEMRRDILMFIKECENCQRNKSENIPTLGLLQPLPIPTKVWMDISMNFIEGLPNSHRRNVIMVVVDHLSKYVYSFYYLIHIQLQK